MSSFFFFFFLVALTQLSWPVCSLRFAHTPITVDTEVLLVGRPAKLTCNYVKLRTETVRNIAWYAGYNGIKTKIFTFHVGTGAKEGSQFSYIKTDLDSATESELTITLAEFRFPIMTLGCDVEVLRDSGYGKLKDAKKMEEVNVTVVSGHKHQLLLRSGLASESGAISFEARVGESLTVTCTSSGSEPSPNLTLTLNKHPWESITTSYVSPVEDPRTADSGGASTKSSIIGELSFVSEDMFITSETGTQVMVIECVAKYRDYLFDKKELVLHRQSSSPASYKNPYLRDINPPSPATRSAWGDTGRSEMIGESHRRRQDQNYDVDRRGKVFNQDPNNMESIAHSGRRYQPSEFTSPDSFAGYILVISDQVDPEDASGPYAYSGHGASSTVILGGLPDHIKTFFYGRYNEISLTKHRIKLEPIEILNILGSNGFRVVESSAMGQKVIWTLEHHKFN